jgi:hypothetical protein
LFNTRFQIPWRHLAVAGVLAVFAIALLAPMASNERLPSAPDHANHTAAIVQARMALEEGQFPLRVAPWQHFGWRYPLFQFYSPVPYTVAGLVHKWIAPQNPFVAYKITLWGAFLLGGFSMYLAAHLLTRSRAASMLAGVIYMSTPYFLINVHVRGAFTEAVGQGLLPLVLYLSLRAYFSSALPWLLLAGIAWGLLALTHSITFVWGAFFAGLFFLAIAVERWRVSTGLWRVGLAFALGCALSLYFLVPTWSADYLMLRHNIGDMALFAWMTTLPSLLSPISMPAQPPAGWQVTAGLNPAIGWPILMGAATVVAARWQRRGDLVIDGPRAARISGVLIGLFALAVFLTWTPFDFWHGLPPVALIAQFSYRLLLHVAWTGSLLAAYALAAMFRGQASLSQTLGALLLILFAHSSWLPALPASDVSVTNLVQRPDLGYGNVDCLADPRRFPIDPAIQETIPLDAVDHDGWLALDRKITVPRARLRALAAPTLQLHGTVPSGIYNDLVLIGVTIDDKQVDAFPLIEGPPLDTRIVLPATSIPDSPDPLVHITLSSNHSVTLPSGASGAVNAARLAITGLKQTITVQEALPRCTRTGDEIHCQFQVTQPGTMAQLPMLFYPKLLAVRVDGAPAPYVALPASGFPERFQPAHGVLPYLLASVRLDPGVHDVYVRFQGQAWANWLSAAAWIAALAGLLISGLWATRRPTGEGARPDLLQ